jgi:hypothetical protein
MNVFRDQEIRGKTLQKGEIYKNCILIDCTNQGALLDDCTNSSGSAPIYAPQEPQVNQDESSYSNL